MDTFETMPVMRTLLLLIGLPLFCQLALAASDPESPESQYRVLESHELVPEHWEPPVIAQAHDKVATSEVDPDSVVQALDQQLITLPGYMRPVVFEGNNVSEFLLVPFLPHHMKQHAHLDANQMVYVSLLEPMQVDNPMAPLWVVGTLSLKPVFTQEGMAAYSVGDGLATEYQY